MLAMTAELKKKNVQLSTYSLTKYSKVFKKKASPKGNPLHQHRALPNTD